MVEKDADLQKIKALIEIMEQNQLLEVEIKHGDDKIFIKRANPKQATTVDVPSSVHELRAVPSAPLLKDLSEAQGQSSESLQEEHLAEIKSPIVGTFYEAPSPDSEPYVEIGSHVDTQTVVCIVEAMKVMNEIRAETSGTIVEKIVANGQAVEYGQVLFRVRPD